MVRKSTFVATLFVLALAATAHAQAPQSLGDLARQVRSQKSAAQTAPVITNDSLSSGAASAFAPSAPLAAKSAPASPSSLVAPGSASVAAASSAALSSTNPGANLDQVRTALDRLDTMLNQVDELDAPTLIKHSLGADDKDFPGRGNWEQRLLAARTAYVSHGRELIRNARELLGSAQDLDSAHATPGDPRVKELNLKLAQFVQDCVRTGTAFQAVMLEGRDLAHPEPPATH